MLLFTVGPVMMYPETIAEYGKQLPYFRTNEFSEIMMESEILLKKLLFTDASSKTAFFTMSGSGAMEATVINIFDNDDKLLIINGGTFGQRFEDICEIHDIPFETIKIEFEEKLVKSDLEHFKGKGFTGLLVNMDETSTGQLYDIGMISDFCKSENIVLVVDAISAFLADKLQMDKMGIDAVIISSQKALSLEPGISIVVINENTYNERVMKINPHSMYMNIKLYVENQKRGQTPFTPAVGTLLCLNNMLKKISKEGIQNRIEKTGLLAEYFRMNVKKLGFEIPDYPLSNAVTPLIMDCGAYELFERLKERHNITVTPNGGVLKDTVLRIGHIGNLNKEDYDELLKAMKEEMH